MRGMFTAGVLDTFMDEDIIADGIISVSAGALFGPNYFSKQKGRALRYNKKFCKDRRYMSFLSLLTTGNLVNKQFAFYDVTYTHGIFFNSNYFNLSNICSISSSSSSDRTGLANTRTFSSICSGTRFIIEYLG